MRKTTSQTKSKRAKTQCATWRSRQMIWFPVPVGLRTSLATRVTKSRRPQVKPWIESRRRHEASQPWVSCCPKWGKACLPCYSRGAPSHMKWLGSGGLRCRDSTSELRPFQHQAPRMPRSILGSPPHSSEHALTNSAAKLTPILP